VSGFSSASVARARWRALFTEATVVSSSSAASDAFQRSTSHRMRTARCRGGRCWRAATNASRTDSRATARSAGSPSGFRTRSSATGVTQTFSARGGPSGSPATEGPVRSIGRARRWLALSMLKQTLVAMRYSQERSAERPSNRSRPRQALVIVSWTASSASNAEPSSR
jgi:hypothetical protein